MGQGEFIPVDLYVGLKNTQDWLDAVIVYDMLLIR